jgi:hypothetical protein
MALILDREVLDAPAVAVVDADAYSFCMTVDPPKHPAATPATVMQLTADAASLLHSGSPTNPSFLKMSVFICPITPRMIAFSDHLRSLHRILLAPFLMSRRSIGRFVFDLE